MGFEISGSFQCKVSNIKSSGKAELSHVIADEVCFFVT